MSLPTGTKRQRWPPASSGAPTPRPPPSGWWAGSTTSSRRGEGRTSNPTPSSSRGMSGTCWTSSRSCWCSPWAPCGSAGSCWAWRPGGCAGPGSSRRPDAWCWLGGRCWCGGHRVSGGAQQFWQPLVSHHAPVLILLQMPAHWLLPTMGIPYSALSPSLLGGQQGSVFESVSGEFGPLTPGARSLHRTPL